MEGDLRISGYPPPDYEEFASAVRQHRDVERHQPHRRICNTGELQLSSDRVGRRHNNVPVSLPYHSIEYNLICLSFYDFPSTFGT